MTIALSAVQPDERAVFAEALAPSLPSAHRLAWAMLQSPIEAEDAVQDAAYKAWRGRARLRPNTDLKPWFLAIVANECRQRLRSRWWTVHKTAALTAVADPNLDSSSESVDLRRALRRLPTSSRLLLVLRYYMDMEFEQMAAVLHCSPKAAKSRTHRALARLRAALSLELET